MSTPAEVEVAEPGRVLAVFDFDGTIVGRGSLPRFAVHLAGWRAARAVLPGAAAVARFLDPATFKTHALRALLVDRDAAEVQRRAASFADHLLRSSLEQRTVERLRWHTRLGHPVVVVTSALDVYVVPVANALGADTVIASEVVVANGRCTGEIRDASLRGRRKVDAVERWILETGLLEPEVYAYGDSRGDRELVEWACATRTPRRRDSDRRR
jgi:HAD superfamily hydrolase (TIGR01490 family)